MWVRYAVYDQPRMEEMGRSQRMPEHYRYELVRGTGEQTSSGRTPCLAILIPRIDPKSQVDFERLTKGDVGETGTFDAREAS